MAQRVLILETSGRSGQVALAEGEALVQHRRLDETRRHARDLTPAVADLLAAQGWTTRSLDAVIVSRGPGSYTGLRVGIMSAKAFAYATGCALVAVDTFAAIALQSPPAVVDVLADAQQDKIYVQRFACSTDLPTATTPLQILTFSEWLADRERSAAVSGPGLYKFRERLPSDCQIVSATDWDPRAESLLRIGLARLQSEVRDDLWTLEPLYLRPSSAEEKWHNRK